MFFTKIHFKENIVTPKIFPCFSLLKLIVSELLFCFIVFLSDIKACDYRAFEISEFLKGGKIPQIIYCHRPVLKRTSSTCRIRKMKSNLLIDNDGSCPSVY